MNLHCSVIDASAARLSTKAHRSQRLRRLAARLASVGSAAAFGILALLVFNQATQGITPDVAVWRDFGQDYLLARAFVDGIDPYVPVSVLAARYLQPVGFLARTTPTPHPPSMAILVLPLTWLDYTSAVRAWFVLQAAALLTGVYLLLRSLGQRWSARLAPPPTLLLFLWPAVGLDIGLGQSTTLLLALLAAAQLALASGRPRLAGAALGITMLVKPLAWPWVLVLAGRKTWSALVVAALVTVVGWALPAVRFGIGPIAGYFMSVLPGMSSTYATEVTNLSWWTIGPRLFEGTSTPVGGVAPLVGWPPAAHVIGALVPAAALSLAVEWLPPRQTALGVFTAVALLVNPISWTYYLVLAVLPAGLVARSLLQRLRPAYVLIAVASVALLLPGEDELIDFAHRLSAWSGATDGNLALLPSLITLAPSLGVAVLAVLVARAAPAGDFLVDSKVSRAD